MVRRWRVPGGNGLVGLTVVAVLSGCTSGTTPREPAPPAGAAPAPAPLQVQEAAALRVFAVAGDAFFQQTTLEADPASPVVVKEVDARLPVQDAAGLVVVLPLAGAAMSCLQRAALELDVREVAGTALLGVYAGAALSLVQGRPPPSGGDDAARLLDNRPRGTATVTAPGPVEVDVTELYRRWSEGAAFPSRGRRVDPGTPLVLVLRPTAADEGRWRLRLGGVPRMRYTATPGCP